MNNIKNDEVYHRCTATELKEELCEKCPLTEIINKGIQERIIPQIRDQQSLLTKEQFNTWVNKEVESASKSMQEARSAQIDQSKVHASEWNELYHWNKARIQALNQIYEKNIDVDYPDSLLNLKSNECQYLYFELTKDGYFMPKDTNKQHFNYVFGGGVPPHDFEPLCWNRKKQTLSELIILIIGNKTTSVPRLIQRNANRVFVDNKNKSIGELSNPKKTEYSYDYITLENITEALKSHSP